MSLTDRARLAIRLARSTSREWQHGGTGTEHLLVGLIREEQGVAAKVLRDAGVTEDTIISELRRQAVA